MSSNRSKSPPRKSRSRSNSRSRSRSPIRISPNLTYQASSSNSPPSNYINYGYDEDSKYGMPSPLWSFENEDQQEQPWYNTNTNPQRRPKSPHSRRSPNNQNNNTSIVDSDVPIPDTLAHMLRPSPQEQKSPRQQRRSPQRQQPVLGVPSLPLPLPRLNSAPQEQKSYSIQSRQSPPSGIGSPSLPSPLSPYVSPPSNVERGRSNERIVLPEPIIPPPSTEWQNTMSQMIAKRGAFEKQLMEINKVPEQVDDWQPQFLIDRIDFSQNHQPIESHDGSLQARRSRQQISPERNSQESQG